jgi:hypothetical protein
LAEIRLGHELGSKRADWRYPSAAWVAEAERLAALADRLPAVLGGTDRPANDAERLTLAQMAYHAMRCAGAARLWGEAFAADPAEADDLKAAHRYNAACAAALAGSGQGVDAPDEEDARAAQRRQALDWLRADLALRVKQFDAGEVGQAEALRALRHWRQEKDFAGVRDADALGALPVEERADWKALWSEVDSLLGRAGGAR